MVLSNHYRLKASSLTESIMAMAIISICLAMATTIYVRVLKGSMNLPVLIAKQEMKAILFDMVLTGDFQDAETSFPSFELRRRVVPVPSSKGAYQVDFELRAGDRSVTYKHIVLGQR